MDIKIYKEKLDERKKLTNRQYIVDKEISLMRKQETNRVGEELLNILYQVFPKKSTRIEWRWVNNNDRMESFQLNLTNYFILMLKEKFPKEINRRFKHNININVNYNILEQEFEFSLYENLYVIMHNSKLLKQATEDLMENVKKIVHFKTKDINDLLPTLENIKKLFDNYDAYLLAVQLEKAK